MTAPVDMQARSQALGASVSPLVRGAYERATVAGHRYVDVPHLVRVLLKEAQVVRAVAACGADLDEVKAVVDGTLDEQPKKRFWHFGTPWPRRAFTSACEGATLHAFSAELDRVTPVQLLVRALAAEPDSVLTGRLDAFDIEPLRLMRFDAHGRVYDPPLRDGRGPARVVLLNDPYTTMEAVVEILQKQLDLSPEDAHRTMRNVHEGGRGGVVFRSWDEARRRAESARKDARERGFPLELELEPA